MPAVVFEAVPAWQLCLLACDDLLRKTTNEGILAVNENQTSHFNSSRVMRDHRRQETSGFPVGLFFERAAKQYRGPWPTRSGGKFGNWVLNFVLGR